MFKRLKEKKYFDKARLLFEKGLSDGRIQDIEDEIYETMENFIFCSIPVSIEIKHLRPLALQDTGRCYDRSLIMFLCFDDAVLVRGNNKDLEIQYGKNLAGHGWVEMNGFVYDVSLLKRFDKKLFYEIYECSRVKKITLEEFKKKNPQHFNQFRANTLEVYKNSLAKRDEIIVMAPVIKTIIEAKQNTELKQDFEKFLTSINYDSKKFNKSAKKNI
ncbi:MAG: hypothetical protein R3Y21_02735 [Mycoplasmatota bacterium]